MKLFYGNVRTLCIGVNGLFEDVHRHACVNATCTTGRVMEGGREEREERIEQPRWEGWTSHLGLHSADGWFYDIGSNVKATA